MSKIIPNKNTWIGFTSVAPTSTANPTAAWVAAATRLTPLVISINASATGNTVPTPTLDTDFDQTIQGTVQGSFTADFYRDSDATKDLAWTTLTRGTIGWFIISRFGTAGATPVAGAKVEIWPVRITTRQAGPLSSNTAMTFTCMAAIPEEPIENATVAA